MGRKTILSWLFVMAFGYLGLACKDSNDDSNVNETIVRLPREAAFSTGLPVLVIDTPDSASIKSKVEWVNKAHLLLVVDGREALRTTTSIRGRGNVTWRRFPKKSYSLKLDITASLLGMKASRRWVLLANWGDRTLLRNDVAFEVARHTSLEWTPQGFPVELVLNGAYMGEYFLCEKIQVGRGWLDIANVVDSDRGISDGYLMEIDSYYDEENKFRSAVYDLPYQFRFPDDGVLSSTQFSYMQNYVDSLEQSLSDTIPLMTGDYSRWLDPQSFADWWIVYELCYNKEIGKPKSVYMYKRKGGPVMAGPVWDFDYSTFTPHHGIYAAVNFPYLRRLFLSQSFRQLAKQRWTELRPGLQNIPDYIEQRAQTIRISADQNFSMWPINAQLNGDEQLTFDEAVKRMRQSFQLRMSVIDNFVSSFR